MRTRTSPHPPPECNRRFQESADSSISLKVTIATQTIDILQGSHVIATFPVSTSKFGIGFKEGSFQTPLGTFRIREKIGDQAPEGAIFKARVPTGEIASLEGNDDLILTRILRLDGCDLENANTWERYIYIHGTNQESFIGSPASHGCIRMRNKDIIKLYQMTPLDTLLLIAS